MAIAHDPYEVGPPVDHGWATTALHSMLSKEASSEELKSVWTTAALVLKGYDAVPVELKILLDRLFVTYHDSIRLERRHRLAYLGWSEEEYERGYKIVVSNREQIQGGSPRPDSTCRWQAPRVVLWVGGWVGGPPAPQGAATPLLAISRQYVLHYVAYTPCLNASLLSFVTIRIIVHCFCPPQLVQFHSTDATFVTQL